MVNADFQIGKVGSKTDKDQGLSVKKILSKSLGLRITALPQR